MTDLMNNQKSRVRIARRVFFSAAVELSKDEFSGYNYALEAHLTGPIAPKTGMIFSIRKLDEILSTVTRALDHKFLNRDVEEFKLVAPTVENIAAYCFNNLQRIIEDNGEVRLEKVRLYETDDLWVDYGPRISPEL